MGTKVWAVWPSISVEKSKACAQAWRKMGYNTAVLMDGERNPEKADTDMFFHLSKWEGFPKAANHLLRTVPGDVIVMIGDDILPDPNHSPEALRERFLKRFPNTFGVASPTGDKYGCWDIACISPWIGRQFIEKAYDGQGPYWEGYWHYYSDAELQAFAQRLKCFVQWEDVNQYHDHWQRRKDGRPTHLLPALERYPTDKKLFEQRKQAGFPYNLGDAWVGIQREAWSKFYKTHLILESGSGLGSSLNNTKEIRAALPVMFDKYNIRTFADIPCGDWNWMRHVPMGDVAYTGYDIVDEILATNRKRYPKVNFENANILYHTFPAFDLVLVRDLFFHFSNEWILKALRNLKASKSKWLLTTSFPEQKRNTDLVLSGSVGFRKINLTQPPFNFPLPEEVIQENKSEACQGRIVGLWDLGRIS